MACHTEVDCMVVLQMRPTPPHLTSAAAEALLAQACENESNNAKRMRMGLEPLPVRHRAEKVKYEHIGAHTSIL